ncbi:diguanylate cyclase [Natronosporangium hydrolyticum]|uniref:Diguanylate cyclase n=1 Tax=Natronosporangium hydrolyticum TaxID=2811111 RepID=A0A895YFK0_9ACTN|nr:diguanylate cyclase [Natronosporangium hydrolyticum]QSB13316.1 diguanylate cyclase [Natronosporangium hydrolyticum]
MTTDGGPATQAPPIRPVRVEVLHESERTRVTRLHLPPDGTAPRRLIRKEPRGPGAGDRLRHEQAILSRLDDVAGVAHLAPSQPYPGSLLLTDAGAQVLAAVATPMEPVGLGRLALALARAVAALHRAGVVHRDINPANIVLGESAATGGDPAPSLIDFTLATTASEVRPAFTHLNEIIGTLPYLAPEQTGRAGRPVDQRADLYALGATLYELATGSPPFGSGDPLRLSHDHLAKVPTPPREVNPAVSADLSGVIMHLLEKEPDNRYQTADGLVHDLVQLTDGHPGPLRIGERDYPLRIRPPSRLVGREAELDSLAKALRETIAGSPRSVLIDGVPGVGKSSLIDELRPVVTAHNGWFVAGKFDPYRRDQEFEASWQAFRQLGRLLLAESEETLADLRPRLLTAMGPNAGLLAALHPEFATLLNVSPDPNVEDPLATSARLQRMGVELLREIASPARPVVYVVDDLQWSTRITLSFLDTLLTQESVPGLLVVAAYRSDGVDVAHPLTGLLDRWRRQPAPPAELHLRNLPTGEVAELLADVLRASPAQARELSALLRPYTGGNPFDTVELLNSLRREGLLVPGDQGWRWDTPAMRHRLAGAAVSDLVGDRVETMPPATRALLQAMACLGGRAELGVLRVATGLTVQAVERQLEPAIDDGLLVMEPGHQDTVRFRHDRVQQDILRRLRPRRERALRLRLARRLASRPGLFAVAAEQYLTVTDAVEEEPERHQVVDLLRRAADQAMLLSNYLLVERCLAAAARLVDPADTDALVEIHTGRHTALYSLGRLDEADQAYRAVVELTPDPVAVAPVTMNQISSLTNRNRPHRALALGQELLARLDHPLPAPEQLESEIEQGLDLLYQWFAEPDPAADTAPEITDPTLLAVGGVLNRMMPPAYFSDQAVFSWLALLAGRLWSERGPSANLVGPISHLPYVLVLRRDDYRFAYQLSQHILTGSDGRGWEPATSHAKFLHALGAWSREPIEECARQAAQAREGLLRGGDLQNAGFSYVVTVCNLLDSAPTLTSYLGEVEAAMAFTRRTGNDLSTETFSIYRRLVATLRGEPEPAETMSPSLTEPYTNNQSLLVPHHLVRAILAALFGEAEELDRHTAPLLELIPRVTNTYSAAIAVILRALALAEQARTAPAAERPALLADLDQLIEWVAARAADAPENFLHLLRLLEGERAWATDDFRTASYAFDLATREAASRQRPWHQALIREQAARFQLSYGLEHAGQSLLAQARQSYVDWGAEAKVQQLDWAYPALQHTLTMPNTEWLPPPGGLPDLSSHRSSIMPGTIDLLGILAASQALSSETNVDGLRERVAEVLSAMTGATAVRLLIWGEEEQGWLLTEPGSPGGRPLPLAEAGREELVPVSVVRYAERTGEPLVVADATRDDRFARDPYLAQLDACSLLAVPIRSRGELQALLLLENRLLRGAFTADRLDGVLLIAGQLAVSLRNALVYSSLERKVAERTEELALANTRLERLSVTDALTGLANRRRLEEVLAGEWDRARRAERPLALAMVDIDHFKLYNDHFGHAAGDRCLQRVATLLRRQLRGADLVARYGGEEFAVVMPGTDLEPALHAAERLRAAMVALAEPNPLVSERVVTVSVGVAAMIPGQQGRVGQLSELADVELYRAKRAGRNRVMPESPELAPPPVE